MTTKMYLLTAVAVVAGVAGRAHADESCSALTMSEPARADLERCLKSRPLLTVGAVGSLTLGGDDGFRATLLGQVDVNKIKPLYASARARVSSEYSEVDLMAGFAFSSSYGAGNHTTFSMSNTYHSPTATGYSYTQTTTAHTDWVVQRNAWLVLGGVRGVRREPDAATGKKFDAWKTYTFGLGNHYANSNGQHTRIEALVVTRDGEYGFSLKWFNMVVGMEVGWVPVDGGVDGLGKAHTTSMFYWNFIDAGLFTDLW